MKKLNREQVCYVLSADNSPVLRVAPGEPFKLETEDAYGGSVKAPGDRFPVAMRPNPATGPVFIQGSERGHTLRISIDAIKVLGSATMASPATRILPIRAGRVFVGKGMSIPVDPMIGVIGTAPEFEEVPTTTPGEHGGNMDCKEIRPGRILYLPVTVEGALLAAGDVHALQGDGEVCGCGAEVAAEITLRAWSVAAPLPTPCVETPEHLMFISSAKTLDECEDLVIEKTQGFLTDLLGIEPGEALRMMSLVGDLYVCQVVDPLKTMRFSMPKAVLSPLGLASVGALAPQ